MEAGQRLHRSTNQISAKISDETQSRLALIWVGRWSRLCLHSSRFTHFKETRQRSTPLLPSESPLLHRTHDPPCWHSPNSGISASTRHTFHFHCHTTGTKRCRDSGASRWRPDPDCRCQRKTATKLKKIPTIFFQNVIIVLFWLSLDWSGSNGTQSAESETETMPS